MPAKDQAAYMRDYRAKKKHGAAPPKGEWVRLAEVQPAMMEAERLLNAEIDRLTAEVARLKRELAARPEVVNVRTPVTVRTPALDRDIATAIRANADSIRNPYAEFHPAPKGGPKPKR